MTKKLMNPRNAYGETLVKLGKRFSELVVLDADLSKSTKTIMFANINAKVIIHFLTRAMTREPIITHMANIEAQC